VSEVIIGRGQSFTVKVSCSDLPDAGCGILADLVQPTEIVIKQIMTIIAENKLFILKDFML
jgi:hypothetical protein